MKLCDLLLLALVVLPAQGVTLYGAVTQEVDSDDEMLMYTVKFDITTGATSNVTTGTGIYWGDNLPYNGISAFDQANGTYYYATGASGNPTVDNAELSYVYVVNVRRSQFLNPIPIPGKWVIRLNYDSNQQRLLILYQHEDAIILASAKSNVVTTLFEIPASLHVRTVATTSVDDASQRYYLTLSGATASPYGIVIFDLKTGALLTPVSFDAKSCGVLVPQFAYYNASTASLIGGSLQIQDNNDILQTISSINVKTGECQLSFITLPDGLVNCWSYDPRTKLLWFAEALVGNLIFSFDTIARKLSEPIRIHNVNGFGIINMEVSYE